MKGSDGTPKISTQSLIWVILFFYSMPSFSHSDSFTLTHETNPTKEPQICYSKYNNRGYVPFYVGCGCLRVREEGIKKMAESIIAFFLEKLNNLLSQEASLLGGVKDQVGLLRDELEWMRLFLKHTDAKRTYDERLKLWVHQIREVTYRAEDVIDEFVLKLDQHRQQQRRFYFKLFRLAMRCPYFANELLIVNELDTHIRNINTEIENMTINKSRYAIESLPSGDDAASTSFSKEVTVRRREKMPPFVEEFDPVELQDDAKGVKRMLVEGERRRTVVSIVGMGGLGKTTLAKQVYNRYDVKQAFDCHAWVYISQEYRFRELLLGILNCVRILSNEEKRELKKMGESEVGSKLCNHLRDKKYLIVMDNMWSTEAWDGLSSYFPPDVMNGSRILITSRNKEIALHADPCKSPLELCFLNEVETWKLFLNKIYRVVESTTDTCPPELEEVGKKIVAKCRGLPLAIVVLGGLLSKKEKTEHAWQKVLDGVNWHLKQGLESCLEILTLSYNDLPYYLKSCFLYCGLFPKGCEIRARRLMCLWIAEGFIQRRGEETMEDVAENYLEELIHRNMIQLVKRRSDGGIKICRIHDLLRDLTISEAKECKFFESNDNIGFTSPTHVRRLTIHPGRIKENTCQNFNTSHIRSLICFAEGLGQTKWGSLRAGVKFLTVLDLEGMRSIHRLPSQIGGLLYLKYLWLRGTGIRRLPPSVGRLVNLQTLNLRYTFIHSMPCEIWKLHQLRHLYGHGEILNQSLIGMCMNEDLGVGHLTNLHTLGLRAGDWLYGGGLGKLTQLRKLKIQGNLIAYKEVFSKSLAKLTSLRSLELLRVFEDKAVIPALMPFSHHACLYKLHLEGRLENLPATTEFYPPNLTKLIIDGSLLKQDPMLTLEKLPNLRTLQLYCEAYVGKKMVCSSGGFLQLEFLTLWSLSELEEWVVEAGAMPGLRNLDIHYCDKMKALPLGLLQLSKLQELNLVNTSQQLINQIRQKEGEDWDNIRRITSINKVTIVEN